MSYDPHDAALDEMYERISDELYPAHKEQALFEFTVDRLQSYYLSNPLVMRPAVDALQEAKRLRLGEHFSAAVIFSCTGIELFLKATLLQPIIHGLVHSPGLADVIVKHAVSQTGFDRYRGLLTRLFQELADLDFAKVTRDDESVALIDEIKKIQDLRNDIAHKGRLCDVATSDHAYLVAVAIYEKVVIPVLGALGLTVVEGGRIERRQFT